jgi:hypothetical protein
MKTRKSTDPDAAKRQLQRFILEVDRLERAWAELPDEVRASAPPGLAEWIAKAPTVH